MSRNDYCPTPAEGSDYTSILTQINTLSEPFMTKFDEDGHYIIPDPWHTAVGQQWVKKATRHHFRRLTTISCVKRQNNDAGSEVCGAYTRKLFPCAPFVHNFLSVYPILRGKWGICRKIISLCPTYHKKVDLAGHFFCICPAMRKNQIFSAFGELVWGTGG